MNLAEMRKQQEILKTLVERSGEALTDIQTNVDTTWDLDDIIQQHQTILERMLEVMFPNDFINPNPKIAIIENLQQTQEQNGGIPSVGISRSISDSTYVVYTSRLKKLREKYSMLYHEVENNGNKSFVRDKNQVAKDIQRLEQNISSAGRVIPLWQNEPEENINLIPPGQKAVTTVTSNTQELSAAEKQELLAKIKSIKGEQ